MRILVVDDHELVRKGIRWVLSTAPAYSICGEAMDGLEAVERAIELRPDLVIMDISMPRLNGLEATKEIRRILPGTEVVIVSQHDSPEMIRQAFSAGARAYVVKSTISTDLIAAIEKARRHEPSVKGGQLSSNHPNLDSQEILQRSAAFEKALRESEDRFRSAMNNMAEGLYILDDEGKVTYVNPSGERMFGWSSAEILGKKMHELIHYKHQDGKPYPSGDCPISQARLAGTEIREYEDVLVRKDGSFLPVVLNATTLKVGETGTGIVVSFRDDTKRRTAEDSLRNSERIYRAIGESINYGIWISDPDGRNIYASPSLLVLVGMTQQEFSDNGWMRVIHPEDSGATVAAWQHFVHKGTFWERENRFFGTDGNWHHILTRGAPIRDEQGKVLYWAGINLDIQKLKETEIALRTTTSQFQRVTDTMAVGVIRCNRDQIYLYVNSRYAEWMGQPASQIVGKSLSEILGEQAYEQLLPRFQEVLAGKEISFEAEIEFKHLGRRWVFAAYTPTLDAAGKVDGWVTSVVDITGLKRKDADIARQARLLEFSLNAVIVRDPDDRITYWNKGAEELYGWTRSEALGKYAQDLLQTKFPGSFESIRTQLLSEEHWQGELTRVHKSGKRITVLSRWTLPPDAKAGSESVMEVDLDLSQGKEAERTAGLLAAIVASSDDAIVSKDLNGIITSWNQSAEHMFGYTFEEAVGQHITLIIPKDRRQEEVEILERLKRGERIDHFETVRMRKDGSLFDIGLTLSPVKDNGGRVIGASKVARDITDRKILDAAWRESEERFRAIVDASPECVKLVSADGTVLQMNASGLAIVGADRAEQVVGKSVYDLIAPHDRDRYRAFNQSVCAGARGSLEFDLVKMKGDIRRMESRAVPLRFSDHSVVQLGLTRDITERKRVEEDLRKGEDRLRNLTEDLEAKVRDRTQELQQRNAEILAQAEQLRELSNRSVQTQDEERRRIARELHDGVGQLLAALDMNLSTIRSEREKLSPDAVRSLDENASLISQASQEIRTMSHLLHPPLLDEVGLESALRWYVDGFAERSKIAVRMDVDSGFSAGLPRELTLPLFRVVQECLTNVHRHSGSPTASVSIERNAREIKLVVHDHGKGIPEDIHSKISSGESSGVGLRGMKERMRQFGGRLEIYSDPSGTRVVAVLPLPGAATEESEATRGCNEKENGKGNEKENGDSLDLDGKVSEDAATILCIDDEADGLLPRKLLLESAGYRVIEARSGEEGIRLFQSEKIDAVILDYWMSGMKGTAVASELKRMDASVPIIVLSGMADLPGEAAGLVDQWLVKGSHRAEHLLQSIGNLLDRRPV